MSRARLFCIMLVLLVSFLFVASLVVGTNAMQYCVPRTEVAVFFCVAVKFRNSI